MDRILNIDAVKEEMENSEWYEYDEFTHMRSVFLGTVFSLLPSGKYYTPWASSNVDLCPNCKGSGHVSHYVPCEYCNRGDRHISDIARSSNADIPSTAKRIKGNGQTVTNGIVKCWVCDGVGFVQPTCETCNGIGSEEAYQDQLWYEQIDDELSDTPYTLEPGEGDPCDLFIVEYQDYDD